MIDPLIAELRGLVQQINLKSQINAAPLGQSTPSTDEDIGGKRPSGGINHADDWSLEAGEYWMKSADYFQRRLDWILLKAPILDHEKRIRALVEEARETLKRWNRSPLDLKRPESMSDPKWAIFVAYSGEDAGTLARWYGCTRQHIYATRKKYAADAG